MKKEWFALFSQTGSEIADIINKRDKLPSKIFTNNADVNSWHPDIKALHEEGLNSFKGESRVVVVKPQQAKTCNFLHKYVRKNDLVTLHGWLRIVPADKCEYYNIVNGHPGLINIYPELKGKDPQIRFWENKKNYALYGAVVHKCTPTVDGGEIFTTASAYNNIKSKDRLFSSFKEASLVSWMKYFNQFE